MAKAKFERTKPHVSIGTIGHLPLAKSAAAVVAAVLVAASPPVRPEQLVGRCLTRAVTAEQIMAGVRDRGPLQRVGGVRSIDEEARTVEVAFSSEEPVERWFGAEVLDHGPGAVDLSRLQDGGAVLVNHDRDQQVGVVVSARVDADRRGRAVIRFGKGAAAEEVWRDIVDGIRRHVSVGYSIEEVRVEEKKNQPDLVTMTRWTPYEVSIVAVPADPTVGVGRAAGPPEGSAREAGQSAPHRNGGPGSAPSDEGSRSMWETITENGKKVRVRKDAEGNIVERQAVAEETRSEPATQPAPAISAEQVREAAAQQERQRVTDIMALGRTYGQIDAAAEFAADGTRSATDFQAELLNRISGQRGGQSRQLNDRDNGDPRIGLSDSEVRQYSFLRAIRAVVNPHDRTAREAAAFELEASEAARSRMGRDAEGLVIPVDVLTRALNSSSTGAAAGDTGGYLIDQTLLSQSFIDVLRNRSVFLRRATPMGGLIGDLAIPKKTSASQSFWIGEDQDAPETGAEFGDIKLSPKTCAALTEITRRALMQTSLDVEALMRLDIAEAIAQGIDIAGWAGTGAGTQPLGLSNLPGLAVEDFAVAGNPSWAEIVSMESTIGAANADVSSMAYVMPAGVRGALKTKVKADGQGGFIWESGNTVNGYGTEVTNQVAAGEMFFGNFADALVGMWGGLEITTDPYTHSAKGRLRIVAMQDVDIQYRRVASFVQGKAVV